MYNIMVFSFVCHYNLFGIMLGMTIDMDGICKQLMFTCHIIYNVTCKHQIFAYASIKSSGEFLHICKLVRASIAQQYNKNQNKIACAGLHTSLLTVCYHTHIIYSLSFVDMQKLRGISSPPTMVLFRRQSPFLSKQAAK